ncbi:MAG: hypothetical protein PUD22_02610 [Erysipelotrichaceae bacterium]|nr:hypothetical protein [Erysipelotrichaceae bacterium]
MEEYTISRIFEEIIVDYVKEYNLTDLVMPKYILSDDLTKAYLEIRPRDMSIIGHNKDDLNGFNGYMIPPEELDGTFIVLINRVVLLDNINNKKMDWVGTIVHETTHAQDFSKYAKILKVKNYDELRSADTYDMFSLWTEINARAKGYYFVRKYTQGELLDSEVAFNHTIKVEIPYQYQLLVENYHGTQNGNKQAYLFAQYIGRLFTLQKIFPKQFDDEWIYKHFVGCPWAAEWFMFFKKHNSLEDASKHFDEMKTILGQNFIFV